MKKLLLIVSFFLFFNNLAFSEIPDLRDDQKEKGLYSLPKLYEKAVESTVFIRVYYDSSLDDNFSSLSRFWYGDSIEEKGAGSGFIYSSDGYILTNYHVINGCNVFIVDFFDETSCEARVIGYDTRTDVAVLKVEKKDLTALTLEKEEIKIGQWVFAIGNPIWLQSSLCVGIIGGLNRFLLHPEINDFIQLDININQGNSGGPVLNLDGKVIGMVRSNFIASYATGIAFIIPNNILQKVAEQLIKDGEIKKGRFGFDLLEKTEDGIFLIKSIAKSSPASRAGLLKDDQILEYNGIVVTSMKSFFNYINLMELDEVLNLKICRNSECFFVSLKKEEIK